MARPRILSVGQCAFDHGRITRHLEQTFQARVLGVPTFGEALDALRSGHYDLTLVNRVSDLDGARGLDLIRSMKAEPALADVPVMLVSNYPEAQAEAEALGAIPGFGKADLTSKSTQARLESILNGPPETP
jgi:CheY-like chemotaxis protein